MAGVAKANDVQFVDAFAISSKLGGKKQPLTFNTFMLTEAGDKTLAPEIFRALVGETAPSGKLDKLRSAINEKNAEWHARYRTVDGYNVYGGRSGLAYQPGKPITELAREMGIPVEKILKLASNENPLGMSPKAKKAVEAAIGGIERYPDQFELIARVAERCGLGQNQVSALLEHFGR